VLDASVTVHLDGFTLEVSLRVGDDEVVAVVGPNGAGKTTLLRALAGLTPLDRGRVELAGEVLDDTTTGVHIEPEGRAVGVVFQDYLLFPHLDVVDNVAYGLRARGVARRDARHRASDWLGRVGLADRASSRVRDLSGGQAQRVALARAMATEPALLLLDEPLSAIDASTKGGLRRELRRQLRSSPGARVLVTHDPLDAMALADRLIVLEAGEVTQEGRIEDVTARPRSAWVAQLVGLNLYRGTARTGAFEVDGRATLAVPTEVTGEAFAVVHPRAVSVHRRHPEGSPRNVWSGEIRGVDYEGDRVRVQIAGPVPVVAEVTPASASELTLADGGPVWVSIKATEIDVYPA
jgi:molybdate transport system ATP-binding protein